MLVLRVALLCSSDLPVDRPTMRDVVQMLADAKPKSKGSSLADSRELNAPDVLKTQDLHLVCVWLGFLKFLAVERTRLQIPNVFHNITFLSPEVAPFVPWI